MPLTTSSPAAGAAFRELRHLLLPTLHAVNDRVGWISRGAINYIAERLDVAPAEIYGVATFYALFSIDERPARQVHVCVDLACRAAGGLAEHDLPPGTHPSPCLGACERAPAALGDRVGRSATPRAVRARDTGRGAAHRRWRVARCRGARDRRGPAGRRRRPVARAAATCRPGRPDQPRRLPGDRRVRGAPPGVRHRTDRGHPRGHRLRARRTRRCGVPDRTQVGCRRPPAGPPAPPRLQRRRVGARHVQGPRPDRGRSVRADRIDDDRRRSPPAAPTDGCTCAASTHARSTRWRPRSSRRAPAAISATTSSVPGSRSTSRCSAAPARTSAARRRRSSTRSRGSAASRATSRRSRSRSGCSASRRSSTTSRRSSTSCRSSPAAGRRSPRSAPRGRRVASCSACRAPSPGPACSRSSSAPRCASCSNWRAACAAAPVSRRSCWAARPAASSVPTTSTCRSRWKARARPARHSARASCSCSTTRST